jgi:FAD/FMN-containing dehydrogenase/Fe-S oxidoreductase
MNAPADSYREIPFNYTSADDRLVVLQLLGEDVWEKLQELRGRRVTGRSARLLQRVFGEVSIHRRNPFLFQELLDSPARLRHLAANLAADLAVVEQGAADPLVHEVLAATRRLVADFELQAAQAPRERQRILAALAPLVGRENVLFDPFTLVSHATDATDWRLHLPAAVVMPTAEAQVAPLLAAVASLGLSAIPRGAGTGLTGGAVPLRPGCVVVNTEKLNHVLAVEEREFPAAGARAHAMRLEAGVITERAMEEAARRGLVFATDPTSSWACTIGGNVAENAGGKMAVLWGTCIDNLLAWRMAMPSGATWTVRRADHRLRKILPGDRVTWQVEDAEGRPVRTVSLLGSEIRRNGLWKDITNKALGGLPGVQKEGTDGIITSAEFVLYPRYPCSATLCLEFFGPDMEEASEVVLALSRSFPEPGAGKEALQALEHFDDEYVRAIGYKVKAPRAETPRAVLLVDVVGHSPEETARGVDRVRDLLAGHRNTHLFAARDAAEAQRFWADRKRLGAIAARTNAFKLNEDVVLPLPSLAAFARFCEEENRAEERHNQEQVIRRLRGFLEAAPAQDDARYLPERIASALERCGQALAAVAAADPRALRAGEILAGLKRDLLEFVRGYPDLAAGVERLWAEERGRLIVLATHMHAGDGNVHVNIPVMSSDRVMLRRAERAVDRVMERVASLGGVCSGEHGIGVTKLKYLEPAILEELAAHRRELDPRGTMNPGKLADRALAERIFTPSFNLLELEARILRHGKLEELALRIAKCVRCGKCKADCCVYHPARGLFFHPRNKNLAIGALIEGLLYEAQRERSTGFELLRWLGEVADHCTICHKCAKPCPVDIDTGEVSVLEREILAARGFKRTPLATRAVLSWLDSRSPAYNAAFRAGAIRLGGSLQRALSRVMAPAAGDFPAPYPLQLLRSPSPRADPRTLRDLLPPCRADQAQVLEPEGEAGSTVFYFPGCGSERLHSSVSMAAVHVLLAAGARVVLPPPFLCCGFPAWTNAAGEQHSRNVLRDTILFSQIREMFSYLRFDAVAVTCGTCREALGAMEAGEIFQAPVVDVARFALDRGLEVRLPGSYLYHPPCHDSLDGKAEAALAGLGARVETVPHCCSEAGTLSLSRPDITDAMLHRKRSALAEALEARPRGAVILTNCPSCLSGLGRSASAGAEPRHLAVELARALSGDDWREAFRAQAARAQTVRF